MGRKRLQRVGFGVGALLFFAVLYMLVLIPKDSVTSIHNWQRGTSSQLLQSVGSQSLECKGQPKTKWDEYACCDVYTTPGLISIEAYAYVDKKDVDKDAFVPDGFEIFRSTDGKNFQCIHIQAAEPNNWGFLYKDRAVQGHQKYYYKVRAFREIRNKKYYGEFSSVMKYIAINSTASYVAKVLTKEGEGRSSLTVRLTSDKGNGDFIFRNLKGHFHNESYNVDGRSDIKLEQYSYDGKKWFLPKEGKLVLKAGQSMYLRFVGYDYSVISYRYMRNGYPVKKFSYRRGERAEIDIYGSYNHLGYILSIDLNELTAKASLDGEAYH